MQFFGRALQLIRRIAFFSTGFTFAQPFLLLGRGQPLGNRAKANRPTPGGHALALDRRNEMLVQFVGLWPQKKRVAIIRPENGLLTGRNLFEDERAHSAGLAQGDAHHVRPGHHALHLVAMLADAVGRFQIGRSDDMVELGRMRQLQLQTRFEQLVHMRR